MNEVETAWLAGLLEGEACFAIKHPGRSRPNSRPALLVVLRMTDRDVVERAGQVMGVQREPRKIAPPKARPHCQPLYETDVQCGNAERVMRAIRPYMGERRGAKIDELLATEGLSHHR